jgi:integrin alpha FG-GAP repeat containing protein 1
LVCDEDNGKDHYYQIWTNNKQEGFDLSQTGRFPSGLQSISFADIGMSCVAAHEMKYSIVSDRDGTIDILFVTCDAFAPSTGVGTGCNINIAYNKQLPLCSPSLQKGGHACRAPEQLCTADPDFRFDMSLRDDNPVSHNSRSFINGTNALDRTLFAFL